MKKIALAAAAILAVTGGALANGSDHYGSNGSKQQAVTDDNSYTASIQKSDTAVQKPITDGASRLGGDGERR
jgi:hypothetical protein